MSSIVTNLSALNAQRNLGITGMKTGKVFEKLSSGYRINRAADDAAGLGISEKMRAQINGNSQAIRNAQDGVSMIQTAEGAMDEIHSILQRMRELGVQAANDTYDTAARDSIATEIDQLRTEVDRIANGTQFNGQNLLTGNLGSTPASVTGGTLTAGSVAAQNVVGGDGNNLQAGKVIFAGAEAGQISSITLNQAAQDQLAAGTWTIAAGGGSSVTLTNGTVTLTAAAMPGNSTSTINFTGTVNGQAVQVSLGMASVGSDFTTAANERTALIAGGNLVLQNSNTNAATVQAITATANTVGGTYTFSAGAAANQVNISDGTNTYAVTLGALSAGTNSVSLGATGLSLTMAASGSVSAEAFARDLAGKTITVTGAAGGAVLQIGANTSSYDQMSISFNDVRASQAGGLNLVNQTVTTANAAALSANVNVDFGTVTGVNGVVSTNDRAQAFVYVIDNAISTLNSRRANLGATQNRLEHTVNSLGVSVENLTASESRIRDADVASLSTRMVSNQILSQAGTAVLAQANQSAQSVLSLLR